MLGDNIVPYPGFESKTLAPNSLKHIDEHDLAEIIDGARQFGELFQVTLRDRGEASLESVLDTIARLQATAITLLVDKTGLSEQQVAVLFLGYFYVAPRPAISST